MKCPLLLAGYLAGYKTEPRKLGNCLKEQCAWWYVYVGGGIVEGIPEGECAILKIARNTGKIGTK